MLLKKTFAGAMILVGVVMGLMFVAPYAIPVPKAVANADPGALTFESVCSTCHSTDNAKNYQGSQNWGEVITLMKSFGAVVSNDQAKEIEQYLQTTYPRDKK